MAGLKYDAPAPPSDPVGKPAFRKGTVAGLKRGGRWVKEAEPARPAAGTIPAQSAIYVGPCRDNDACEVREPPPPPIPAPPPLEGLASTGIPGGPAGPPAVTTFDDRSRTDP